MNFEEASSLINDRYNPARPLGARALGEMKDPRAVKELVLAIVGCMNYQYSDAELGAEVICSLRKHRQGPGAAQVVNEMERFSRSHMLDEQIISCVLTDPGNIPALKRILTSASTCEHKESEKIIATWSSGQLKSQHAVGELLELLCHKSRTVRIAAIKALGELKDFGVVDAFLRILDSAIDAGNGEAAFICEALGKIGDQRASGALIRALRFPDRSNGDADPAFVRNSAALALAALRDPRAINPLIEVLSKEGHHKYLIASAESLAGLESVEAIPALFRLDQYGGDVDVAKAARKALRFISGKRGTAAVEALADAFRETNFHVRSEAAACLGETGVPEAVPPLLTALADENIYVRQSAAESLGRLRDSRSVGPLLEALKNEEDYVRRTVVASLEKLGDPLSIDPLIKLITHTKVEVRSAARNLLVRLEEHGAAEALGRLLWEEDYDTKDAAVELLGKMTVNDRRIIDKVWSEDREGSSWAARELAKVGGADMIAIGLKSRHGSTRESAVLALASLRDARCLLGLHEIV